MVPPYQGLDVSGAILDASRRGKEGPKAYRDIKKCKAPTRSGKEGEGKKGERNGRDGEQKKEERKKEHRKRKTKTKTITKTKNKKTTTKNKNKKKCDKKTKACTVVGDGGGRKCLLHIISDPGFSEFTKGMKEQEKCIGRR